MELNSADAFTLFSIFSALQFTVGTLPHGIRALAEAKVALNRLTEFLLLPEWTPPEERSETAKNVKESEMKGNVLMLDKATLGWMKKTSEKTANGTFPPNEEGQALNAQEEEPATLHEIDLEVKQGELVGVAGGIGSGKSSLVSAIMGEVRIHM